MKKTKLQDNQSGIVSFFVVFIIMIVLTLIVMSFAKLVRREQRQTLDRQLNTQAFYAAETGVNDAAAALRNNSALLANDYNDDCDSFISSAGLTSQRTLDAASGGVISYSCLLVDTSPPELNYDSVTTSESLVVPLKAKGGTPITTVQISWSDAAGETDLSGCPTDGATYPGQWNANCDVGMLYAELLPFQGPSSRLALIKNRSIAYLQPTRTGGTASYSITNSDDNGTYQQGVRHPATCNVAGAPRQCTVRITGLNMTNGYLRLRSIYKNSGVTIRAFNASTQLELTGTQVVVDSTGKANDVLRRIKVTVPVLIKEENFPEFALHSHKTQCKRFELAPPSDINIPWPSGTANDNECNPGQTINN